MTKHLFRAALVSTLLCASAQADTVYFKNGDKLTGTITDLTATDSITMHTNFGQDITVPRKDIARATDDAAKPLPLKPLNIARAATAPSIKTPSSSSLIGGNWKGIANLGAVIQNGNTDQKNFNFDAEASGRYGESHRVTLKSEYIREVEGNVETEDNRKLRGEYDYFYLPKWFINGTADFEQDNVEQIDLRSRVGVGLGHQFYERDDLNLKVVAGPTYLREKFARGGVDESMAGRWSLDYDQKIYRGMFRLFHSHEFLVPTDHANNYLFDSKTGVRMPLGAGIVASAELQFDWDNNPEPGIEKEDTIYALKLGYEW